MVCNLSLVYYSEYSYFHAKFSTKVQKFIGRHEVAELRFNKKSIIFAFT